MEIQVSKSYHTYKTIFNMDRSRHWDGDDEFTHLSSYEPSFVIEDVTPEQLIEYINNGYAIKINF